MSEIDNDTRLAVIREICNREGHGELVEVGSLDDLPHNVLWCRRGCGATFYKPAGGASLESFLQYLRVRGVTGTAYFFDRGLIGVHEERS
jgi:hypothetical protein